jgi:hypothetical protein
MTLEEMTVQRVALLGVRFRGVGTVEMDGRHVTFGTDAETAAAISDLERRIAAAQDGGRRRRNTIRGSAAIIGRSRPKTMLANSRSVHLTRTAPTVGSAMNSISSSPF